MVGVLLFVLNSALNISVVEAKIAVYDAVEKLDQQIPYMSAISLRYGDAPYQLPSLKTDAGLVVSYIISDQTIATISVDNLLTIHKAGFTQIQLIQEGNETYNKATAYVSLQVTRAPLTIYIASKTKIYGDPNPILTIDKIEGFQYQDTEENLQYPIQLSTSPMTDACTPVGSYLTIGYGAYSPNYTIEYTYGTLTVERAKMTVYAIDRAKEYGDPNGYYSSVGAPYGARFEDCEFKCNDSPSSLNLSQLYTTTTADLFSYVGVYPIEIGGAVSNNYWFEYVPATFTIYKAPLLLTPDTLILEYGDCIPQLWTYTSRGFKLNDWTGADPSFVTPPIFITTASAESSVGDYTISLTGASSVNYDINYGPDALIHIHPAPLVVHTESTTKEYGDPDPIFNFTVTGYKNNQTTADFTPPIPYGYTEAPITADAGSQHPIGIANFDPGINYTFSLDTGYLTIEKAKLHLWPLWTTREPLSLNPIIPYYCEGFKLGQDSLVLDRMPVFATNAIYLSPEGDYPSYLVEGEDNNYEFVVYEGRFTIKWRDRSPRESAAIEISISPNPVREALQIHTEQSLERVIVYDMQGAVCQIIEGQECYTPIRLHNTNKGIYLLKVYSDQTTTTLTFEVY